MKPHGNIGSGNGLVPSVISQELLMNLVFNMRLKIIFLELLLSPGSKLVNQE